MKKTLNVGAGKRTYKHYPNEKFECINLDERRLPNIDIVGDMTDLSRFSDGEFDMILASDVIEHAPIARTEKILKEWCRVLKPGGLIEFRLPNIAAITKSYVEGKIDAKKCSWLLYGGQDYSGNFHFVGFDRKFFKDTYTKVGLVEVDYREEGFNMVVKCVKNRNS